MTGKALTYLLCGAVGVVMLGMGGLVVLSGAALACTPRIEPTSSFATLPPSANPVPGYDGEQLTNAKTITAVGISRAIPIRGHVIAVATAIAESSLRNLGDLGADNDHDSLGLFQQRPSQGWGTPDQILDPVHAATKFYDALLNVDGWQQLPLTQAAQAVQRSAHPDAYARWEADATALVALTNGVGGGCDGGDGMSGQDSGLPADYRLPTDTPTPIVAAIFWALQQRGTPYTFGGSCTDPHSGIAAQQCDCSSLVQQAYARTGVRLPRTTENQQNTGSAVTDSGYLLPGDLIFIPGSHGTRDDPGHVGLYIGQGLIVHAPHTGDVVKISRLELWRSQIAKIRRVVAWPPTVGSQPR